LFAARHRATGRYLAEYDPDPDTDAAAEDPTEVTRCMSRPFQDWMIETRSASRFRRGRWSTPPTSVIPPATQLFMAQQVNSSLEGGDGAFAGGPEHRTARLKESLKKLPQRS